MPTDVQLLRKRAPMAPDSIKFSGSRRTILGAATASLMCSGHGARAQTVTAMGEVYINGQRATPGAVIRPGDRVLTGPESTLTLAIGEDTFRLRSLTSVEFGGTPDSTLVSGLRVLTGALLGAFRKSAPRQVQTATATIGIRGTAIYVEANPVHNLRMHMLWRSRAGVCHLPIEKTGRRARSCAQLHFFTRAVGPFHRGGPCHQSHQSGTCGY